VLTDLVRENQERGVPDEVIREGQSDLLAAAAQTGRDRLKGTFILVRIAENEKITVSREEFSGRVAAMASRYNTPFEKMLKDLEKGGVVDKVQEEILTGKVLDFLASSASVSASAPEAAPAEVADTAPADTAAPAADPAPAAEKA